MARIKIKTTLSKEESESIRHSWDANTQEWNYSITDIIALVVETADSRNYWKSFKNRLKNTHKELVTSCNQLKMEANDGKFYLVDSANRNTLKSLLHIIAPYSVDAFESYFDHIEAKSSNTNESSIRQMDSAPLAPKSGTEIDEEKISTAMNVPMDIIEKKDKIVVKFLAPGLSPEKIFLSISAESLTIKGELVTKISNIKNENFLIEELSFGYFYRKINLPNLADVENINATEFHGLIEITITKIDREKERFIKIKSLT